MVLMEFTKDTCAWQHMATMAQGKHGKTRNGKKNSQNLIAWFWPSPPLSVAAKMAEQNGVACWNCPSDVVMTYSQPQLAEVWSKYPVRGGRCTIKPKANHVWGIHSFLTQGWQLASQIHAANASGSMEANARSRRSPNLSYTFGCSLQGKRCWAHETARPCFWVTAMVLRPCQSRGQHSPG